MFTADAVFEFQIAAAGSIENDAFVAEFHRAAVDVGQGGTLGFLHVIEQCARSGNREWQRIAAETVEIVYPELTQQQAFGSVEVKVPLRARGGNAVAGEGGFPIFVVQDFGGLQAFDFVVQGGVGIGFLYGDCLLYTSRCV